MKIKALTKQTHSVNIIHEWVMQKGFDLKIVCISDPVMKISLNVVYGSYKEFKRFIKQEHDHDLEHEASEAMCIQIKKDGVAWNYINIQKNDWTASDYGTIVHELHHFTHFALTEKGVNYGEAGEEVYAYTQGFFMEMVVRAFIFLKKMKKK